jgi:hypothetical protein
LALGSSIPLSKYLLGAVYNLLHQVVVSLSTNSPIGYQYVVESLPSR